MKNTEKCPRACICHFFFVTSARPYLPNGKQGILRRYSGIVPDIRKFGEIFFTAAQSR